MKTKLGGLDARFRLLAEEKRSLCVERHALMGVVKGLEEEKSRLVSGLKDLLSRKDADDCTYLKRIGELIKDKYALFAQTADLAYEKLEMEMRIEELEFLVHGKHSGLKELRGKLGLFESGDGRRVEGGESGQELTGELGLECERAACSWA